MYFCQIRLHTGWHTFVKEEFAQVSIPLSKKSLLKSAYLYPWSLKNHVSLLWKSVHKLQHLCQEIVCKNQHTFGEEEFAQVNTLLCQRTVCPGLHTFVKKQFAQLSIHPLAKSLWKSIHQWQGRVCPSQRIYTEEAYEQVNRSLPKSARLHRGSVWTSQQDFAHVSTFTQNEQVNKSLPKSVHLHRGRVWTGQQEFAQVSAFAQRMVWTSQQEFAQVSTFTQRKSMNKSAGVCPSQHIYTEQE